MKKLKLRQSLLLLLTALIWGVAFVAQSAGMEYVGPFTFNAVRSIIGGIVLIPCIFILKMFKMTEEDREPKTKETDSPDSDDSCSQDASAVRSNNIHQLLLGGLCCGVVLFIASTLQQVGIKYTTVGKAGFTTALYIIIVPVLSIFCSICSN